MLSIDEEKNITPNLIEKHIGISKDFNIPQHYKELDVEKFIYSKIPASGQDVKIITARVDMELN